ncbi:aldo/keto reductase [Pseudorhodoferax soli]|uniref:Aryl-alcohol dehydrogenase-like predicted oxidoreductase n=1 Tax=Pseudorhodoferax soli TaxID=545864 RepID=A0A368Y6Y9_9BURK|nr:aldo/keto reductase [Pseudorhodoferax soli]RCW76043.1 aryl-alcohol dehydrogenase-like predicted oxidoreductase [Pseudorhodoferax soli]
MNSSHRGDRVLPTLALGCARIGSALTPLSRRECIALLDAALELGVRHFDTASIYGQGDSERYIGEALHARRKEVILASKAGQRLTAKQALISQFKVPIRWLAAQRGAVHKRVADHRAQGVPRCFEPDYLERSLLESLKRLRTDHLDIFYLHSPDPGVLDDEQLLRRVEQWRAKGLFRAFGVSCDEDALVWKAGTHQSVDVVQFAFDATVRAPDLLATLSQHGKRVVLRGFLPAAPHGVSMEQALRGALGSALSLPAVEALIVGTTRLTHLRANAQAYQHALADVSDRELRA